MSAAGLTPELARYAAASHYDALPFEVRHEAARALLNWVGVAIGGSGEEAAVLAARFVGERGAEPQATVIGRGLLSDIAGAAFVNCIASSVLAYDDAHLATVAHPSGPAAAALVALAQAHPMSGSEFVNALALGIELQCRIATMLVRPPAPMDPNLYVNGFSGPVGVAAATARALRLDERRLGWAMGLAASQASGFRAVHGTMASHFRPGHACRSGVEGALLARLGFDCIDDALGVPGGFVDVFAQGSDCSLAVQDLGTRHVMLENRYKPYPCGIVIHPVIDACQELRAHLPSGAEIHAVRLLVNPLVLKLTGKREPRTSLESHVSVFHWAAVGLLQEAPGLAATGRAALTDGAVAALRERIVGEAIPTYAKGEALVRVALSDGSEMEAHVRHARGSEAKRMTDGELDAKFVELTEGKLPQRSADMLRDACWRVSELADVGAVMGPLLP